VWIRAYDKTNDSRYLNTAKATADYMQTMWDTGTCNGGVWWNTDRNYKNAITIELYIKLNAAYYNRSGNATYLSRVQMGWNWFVSSGMINSSNLVNDGLTASCANNNGVTWTYNQGVVLGAAAELHRATNNTTYLDKAQSIANATMSNLVHGVTGALRENGCESGSCGNDGALFKGIFMRNLYELNARRFAQANKDFMIRNADVIWANDRNNDQFGLFWSGPYEGNDANRQSSALDALIGTIQYSSGGSQNVAIGKAISASGQCSGTETDGSASTKWCAGGTNPSLVVDLGQNYAVTQFVVKHAGSGGENTAWNTRNFQIQKSDNGTNWTDLVNVTGNTQNITTHSIASATARYFRLHITQQEQGTGGAARIYEFEIYGTASGVPTFQPPTNTPAASGNLALNRPATASGSCATNENAAKAVDGSASTKWCSPLAGGNAWLQVDIGANNVYSVRRFVLKHAGAGGEDVGYNTRDFKIQGSSDASTWYDLVTVSGNTNSTTTHSISAVGFRYFRLWITNPQTNTSFIAARIYEFEVYEN
jgi:hypothetical protein